MWLAVVWMGCADQAFTCGGKLLSTVPAEAVCDGVVDCAQGAGDERADGCETALFYCVDGLGEVIEAERSCDGAPDCSDLSDEAACAA